VKDACAVKTSLQKHTKVFQRRHLGIQLTEKLVTKCERRGKLFTSVPNITEVVTISGSENGCNFNSRFKY